MEYTCYYDCHFADEETKGEVTLTSLGSELANSESRDLMRLPGPSFWSEQVLVIWSNSSAENANQNEILKSSQIY